MKKSEAIKEQIKIFQPYAIAHQIYFDQLGKLKKSQYKAILKRLVLCKLEDNEYFEEHIGKFFFLDTKKDTVSDLAIAFQDYISLRVAHCVFKKDPRNQPLNQQ
jgi:hypothetical protein